MAELKVCFDDTAKDRIIDGICGQYRWPEKLTDKGVEIDNPVTKEQFANNILCSFVKEVVSAYEANKAAEGVRKSAMLKVLNEINLSSA